MNVTTIALKNNTDFSKPYEWILNPWIDLFLCCGGLLWILYGLQYVLVFQYYQLNVLNFFALFPVVGMHLFSNAHTSATLVRVYQNAKSIKEFSFHTIWLAIICCLLAVVSLMYGWSAILFKIYWLWVVQHYTTQSYGIALIYCYKNGYHMKNFEKRILWILMYATAFFGIIRQLVYPEFGTPLNRSIQAPFWGPLPEWFMDLATITLIFSSITFLLMIILKAINENKCFPLPAFLLVVTGVLIFVISGATASILWSFFVPALFHGSQYIVVTTSYYLKSKGLPQNISTSQIATLLTKFIGLKYFIILVAGGYLIYFILPEAIALFGINKDAAYVTVFSVFNFHHFLTDAAIWQLRNPLIRRILLS